MTQLPPAASLMERESADVGPHSLEQAAKRRKASLSQRRARLGCLAHASAPATPCPDSHIAATKSRIAPFQYFSGSPANFLQTIPFFREGKTADKSK